jgi:hypothetical protein
MTAIPKLQFDFYQQCKRMLLTPATVIPSLGTIYYAVTNNNVINLMYYMTSMLNFVIGYLT